LFVTTDVDEALLLADRLLVMTGRPARVREEFFIELSRTRQRVDLLHNDRLQQIKHRAMDLLRPPGTTDLSVVT